MDDIFRSPTRSQGFQGSRETVALTYRREEPLRGDAFSTVDIPRSRAMHVRLAVLADVRRHLATGGPR